VAAGVGKLDSGEDGGTGVTGAGVSDAGVAVGIGMGGMGVSCGGVGVAMVGIGWTGAGVAMGDANGVAEGIASGEGVLEGEEEVSSCRLHAGRLRSSAAVNPREIGFIFLISRQTRFLRA